MAYLNLVIYVSTFNTYNPSQPHSDRGGSDNQIGKWIGCHDFSVLLANPYREPIELILLDANYVYTVEAL